MDKQKELRNLLRHISPVSIKTISQPEDETEVIDGLSNPLDPNLLQYCFDHVLGFEVSYRIAEKVNYVIEFDYKGTYGYVIHRKLSYELKIHRKYKDELLEALQKARQLLSEVFFECGKEALKNNTFTMENEAPAFQEKLDFYSERIDDLEKKRSMLDKEQTRQVRAAIKENRNWTDIFNFYSEQLRLNRLEQKYSIESYIDTRFSCLEHILTLLYPFTPRFSLDKSYSKEFINNPRWTWDKKLSDVACGNDSIMSLLAPLREIKEIYRNRNAHGLFSRELKVYVPIEQFGRYPMYLGKNYLQGFVDDFSISLDYERFCKIRELFGQLLDLLREEYGIPMVFIERGVFIPVEAGGLIEGITSIEEAEHAIEKYYYMMDNQLNMDW